MTSGAKLLTLWSNVIEKHYRGMRRAPQCSFEFFLAYIPLEVRTIICEKNRYFLKIWPLMTSRDFNMDLPENDLRKSFSSCRGLPYAVYRLSQRRVVFEIRRVRVF